MIINAGSLAPLVLTSTTVARAVTGECSGNCDICGCSAERRANHTCCCFLNKQKHEHDRHVIPDCCKKKTRHKMTMLSCNCPCGGNKSPGMLGAENSEQLPFLFTEGVIALDENALVSYQRFRLTDRNASPPDPPPRLFFSA
jgi:hypothetical protein